jgi:hypothetical protein
MKAVKTFVKTCFSEHLIAEGSAPEPDNSTNLTEERDPDNDADLPYHGGLGLKFKFPGDPKKYVFCTVFYTRSFIMFPI